jgi:hypothetical protein
MLCEFIGTLFAGIFLYCLGVAARSACGFGRWWGRNTTYRDRQQRGFQVLPPENKRK